ncbi:uncharacterized protein K452DRAFT_312113 [Aplosporella prunicola CBS 121167]|uniref:ABM domain-containing protein n=1 Tax=Aplosporella prunicola CBS 121167 TaxID=1176127 RepID=A0A6A6B2X6_9PEZI|nr:uncharacterized protein K452DRAFT_312113 [Aplosporella prunicola CBS 121167]KAF2137733.1 hypothetical protein K452DRAFT_312113 [Aplosporella prunicola CBS 121167]
MEYSGPSVSVQIKITIDPSNNDAFLKALKPVFDRIVEEPANTFFEVFQDARQPGVFKLIENWNASTEDVMKHPQTKDYLKLYFAATQPMHTKPLEVEVFNRMPGNELVSFRKDCYPGRE